MAQPRETAVHSSQAAVWPSQPTVADSVGQRRRLAPGRSSVPTVAARVRRFCLDCQGLTSGRGAFDCQSRVCPLYQASPFRRSGRRRASKGLLSTYCRYCQPGDLTDCGAADCALHPWRPWQPGGQPKARTVSEAQKSRLRVIGQSSQFRNPRQSTGTFEANFGSAGPGMGEDPRHGRRR